MTRPERILSKLQVFDTPEDAIRRRIALEFFSDDEHLTLDDVIPRLEGTIPEPTIAYRVWEELKSEICFNTGISPSFPLTSQEAELIEKCLDREREEAEKEILERYITIPEGLDGRIDCSTLGYDKQELCDALNIAGFKNLSDLHRCTVREVLKEADILADNYPPDCKDDYISMKERFIECFQDFLTQNNESS